MTDADYKTYNRSLCLAGYKALVEKLGGNAEELAASVGIPPDALSTPHIILRHQSLLDAMELAAARLNAPCFGLQMVVDGPAHNSSLGPHLLLARLVGNLRDWFDMGIRYWGYHTNSSTSQLIIDREAGLATIRYIELSPGAMTPQYVDSAMAMMVKLGRIGTARPDIGPTLMRLRRPAPPDTGPHRAFFGCEVEFGAAHEEMVLDLALLDLPTSGDLRAFRRVADFYMQFAMSQVHRRQRSLEVSVRHAISALLPTGTCSIASVAHVVGMSAKKLQRQLAAEGQSYSALLEESRESTARQLLADTRIPIEQIAGLLGYSSTVPFTNAFNRWAGTSPLRYRKSKA